MHVKSSFWCEKKTWQDVVDANTSHQSLHEGELALGLKAFNQNNPLQTTRL